MRSTSLTAAAVATATCLLNYNDWESGVLYGTAQPYKGNENEFNFIPIMPLQTRVSTAQTGENESSLAVNHTVYYGPSVFARLRRTRPYKVNLPNECLCPCGTHVNCNASKHFVDVDS